MLLLHAELKRVECVAFSQDGTRLAVGGTGLEVWAIPAYEPVWRWEVAGDPIRAVAFGPDGRWVFGFVPGSAVRVYDTDTGAEDVFRFPPPDDAPHHWAAHRDGSCVVTAVTGRVTCWRIGPAMKAGLPVRAVAWDHRTPGVVGAVALLPDPPSVVTLGVNGGEARGASQNVVVVRDLAHGVAGFTGRSGFARVDELAASPDGSWLVARLGPTLLVWDAAHLKRPPKRVENDSPRQFTGLAFHPSGRWLATAGNDKTIKLRDVETWRVVRSFAWAAGRMRSIAFAPDGLTAAAGGEGGEFVVFDVDV